MQARCLWLVPFVNDEFWLLPKVSSEEHSSDYPHGRLVLFKPLDAHLLLANVHIQTDLRVIYLLRWGIMFVTLCQKAFILFQ